MYGADELGMRRKLHEFREEADGGSGMLMTNLTQLDGTSVKPAEIIGPASSVPFLAPKRLVVVEHFFERFESRPGAAPAAGAGSRRLAQFEPMLAALKEGLPETTILVFTGVSEEKDPFGKNPMVKALKEIKGTVAVALPKLEKEALNQYIRAEAAARGIKFRVGRASDVELQAGEERTAESDPALLLANLLQSDTLAIANELDKLALYTGGGEVGVAEVNRICSGDRETTTFEFVDAVQDGKLAVALEKVAWLMRDGVAYAGLVSQLLTAYRRSATILDQLDDRATPEEIGRTLGPAGRFPGLRDAAIRRARKLGHEGLKAAYAAILESERAFKTGETPEETAFEVMLMRLTGLVGAAPPRPLVPPR